MFLKQVVPIFLVMVGAVATDALAVPTLDQSNLGGGTLRDCLYDNRQSAQTFTVGLLGTLDSIVVDLCYYRGAPTRDITVELRSTTSGLPDGPAQALASVQFDTSVLTTVFTLYSIDFSSFYIPLAVGEQLAIVLFSDAVSDNAASWRGGRDNPYPGGQWYSDQGTGTTWYTKDYDAYFQTYVEVIPAPSGLHLVIVGLAYLARQRRKLR